MKKILIILVFLLNLLPYINEGSLEVGTTFLMGQSWGSEVVCTDDWGENYASWTGSCDEGTVCACVYCNSQIECDSDCSCRYNGNNDQNCRCSSCNKTYNCYGSHSCSGNNTSSGGENNNTGGGGGGSGGGSGGIVIIIKTGFVIKQCDAYTNLWKNNTASGSTKESAAYHLADGRYYLLDNKNNAVDRTTWTEAVELTDKNGNLYPGKYIQLEDGDYSQVTATIHTHPNTDNNLYQGPTIYTDGKQDDYTHLEQFGGKQYPGEIVGYILSNDSVYKYYFTKDGEKKYEVLGTRTSFSNCN